MDATYVLGTIFTAFAEQNGFEYNQFEYIRYRPTGKTKTVMFDCHWWLRIEGYNVDITFEQCRTVQKGNAGEIVFDVHPLIDSDDYIYESTDAGGAEPFAEFTNFIILTVWIMAGQFVAVTIIGYPLFKRLMRSEKLVQFLESF